MNPGFARSIVGTFGALTLFALIPGLYLVRNAARTAGIFRDLDRSNRVLRSAQEVHAGLLGVQAASRGHLLTGDVSYLGPRVEAFREIDGHLRRLQEATADRPAQLDRSRRIAALWRDYSAMLEQRIASRRRPDFTPDTLADDLRAGKTMMDEAVGLLAAIRTAERTLAEDYALAAGINVRLQLYVALLIGAGAAGAVAYGGVRTVREYRARAAAESRLQELNQDLERRVADRTAALRQERDFSATVLDCLPGVFYCYDQDRRFVRWNRNLEAVTGYGAAELARLDPLDLFGADERPLVAERIAQVFATGSGEVEADFRAKDGTRTPYFFTGRRIDIGGRAHLIGVGIDLSARRQAEDRLRAERNRTRVLASRLLEVQESERRQLARDLHDDLGQTLTALKITLAAVPPAGPTPPPGLDLVDRALQQTRALSLNLRPPLLDDLGLVPALRWLADQQSRQTGRDVVVAAEPPPARAAPAAETACFRIAQEALTNALRHSRGPVTLGLQESGGQLVLTVRDEGPGFDHTAARAKAVQGGSLGLLGMEERAALVGGTIAWHTAPGAGTEVRASFPLAADTGGHNPTS